MKVCSAIRYKNYTMGPNFTEIEETNFGGKMSGVTEYFQQELEEMIGGEVDSTDDSDDRYEEDEREEETSSQESGEN